jgi:hypothetical protein
MAIETYNTVLECEEFTEKRVGQVSHECLRRRFVYEMAHNHT